MTALLLLLLLLAATGWRAWMRICQKLSWWLVVEYESNA
jgi:hypothetical protein